MSARGKGKKPLDSEGTAGELKNDTMLDEPTVLSDEALEGPTKQAREQPGAKRSFIAMLDFDKDFYTISSTDALVRAVLEERRRSLPVALAKNTVRNASSRWIDYGLGFVSGLIAYTFDPVVGVVIVTVTSTARNVIETLRIRRGRFKKRPDGKGKMAEEFRLGMRELVGHQDDTLDARDDLPDMPEYNNAWVRSACRLMRYVRGFNARVEVINEMIEDGNHDALVTEMMHMLEKARPRLVAIAEDLNRLAPPNFKDRRELERIDDRVADNDLFGDQQGSVARLIWLETRQDSILVREARAVYERDLAIIEGRIDADRDTLEARIAVLEKKEKDSEPEED